MDGEKLFKEISALNTEKINPDTINIDGVSTKEALLMINDQDALVSLAVRDEIDFITQAVDLISESFKLGGRLFYVGAGTSGRLGIVDASECPPTFGVSSEMVQGIIAGGDKAVFKAQEGAEDNRDLGVRSITERLINPPDIVCGIAASGRTPFVLAALEEAQRRKCKTIFIATTDRSKIIESGVCADVIICPNVGPEAIAGSTRMKSGTAQKMVLNMLTTTSMVKFGKTLGNIMIDLQPTNLKLIERSKKIVMEITGLEYKAAEDLLYRCENRVKYAIVSALANISVDAAKKAVDQEDGRVRVALNKLGVPNY